MGNDNFAAAMEYIVAALEEKGYDSYAQLIGYVTAKDLDYVCTPIAEQNIIAKKVYTDCGKRWCYIGNRGRGW